jgi:hypothetical protein
VADAIGRGHAACGAGGDGSGAYALPHRRRSPAISMTPTGRHWRTPWRLWRWACGTSIHR